MLQGILKQIKVKLQPVWFFSPLIGSFKVLMVESYFPLMRDKKKQLQMELQINVLRDRVQLTFADASVSWTVSQQSCIFGQYYLNDTFSTLLKFEEGDLLPVNAG